MLIFVTRAWGWRVTSEVLLMNLEAVALGADSAVTITDTRDNFSVSQGGVEKIHILNEAGPVAAMVYGGGDFAGLPWKSVLAQYRQAHTSSNASIKAQALDLMNFLSGGTLRGDDNAEIKSFALYLMAFTLDYGEQLKVFGWEEGKPVLQTVAAQALNVLTQEVLYDGRAGQNGKPVPRPLLPESPRMADFLKAHLGKLLQQFLAEMLDGSAFPTVAVQPLIDLAAASVYIEWLPLHADMFITGMVIAGFDNPASPPTLVTVEFLGSFGGILQSQAIRSLSPKPGSNPVVAATFAQDAMTRALLYGVMPVTEHITRVVTATVIHRALAKVLGDMPKSQAALAQQLAGKLGDLPFDAPAIGFANARRHRLAEATDRLWPLLETANVRILADYAAKFMELPVLEHELTRDESVSRPIRVLAMEPGRYFWKE